MPVMDGSAANSGVTLDSAPPQPPGSQRRSTLMDTQRDPGMGAEAGNPQIVIMQGLEIVKQGMGMLSAGLPELTSGLNQILMQLQQVIPQAMADQLAGVPQGAGAGGAMGAMGGGAPAPPPGVAPPPPAGI